MAIRYRRAHFRTPSRRKKVTFKAREPDTRIVIVRKWIPRHYKHIGRRKVCVRGRYITCKLKRCLLKN